MTWKETKSPRQTPFHIVRVEKIINNDAILGTFKKFFFFPPAAVSWTQKIPLLPACREWLKHAKFRKIKPRCAGRKFDCVLFLFYLPTASPKNRTPERRTPTRRGATGWRLQREDGHGRGHILEKFLCGFDLTRKNEEADFAPSKKNQGSGAAAERTQQ